MQPIIPVLLYHSVNHRSLPVDQPYTVSPPRFAAHVEAISKSGREPLLVSELAAGLRGERPLPQRAVAVTFDDGFADTYGAVEVLLRRDVASTVYVTSGEVGAADRLSAPKLAELARLARVEIGAHAVCHRRLDELPESELAHEVTASKTALEDLIQASVLSFAYPHGAYDRRARATVIASGYQSAAAVKNAVSHVRDDPFAISRWTVSAQTSAERISEVLEGRHVPRGWTRERLRTRAYRSVRRSRRRLENTLSTRR
jgi:peptidoglycan/xylan/chitin deacetylase (PgdA/CDA1 family)